MGSKGSSTLIKNENFPQSKNEQMESGFDDDSFDENHMDKGGFCNSNESMFSFIPQQTTSSVSLPQESWTETECPDYLFALLLQVQEVLDFEQNSIQTPLPMSLSNTINEISQSPYTGDSLKDPTSKKKNVTDNHVSALSLNISKQPLFGEKNTGNSVANDSEQKNNLMPKKHFPTINLNNSDSEYDDDIIFNEEETTEVIMRGEEGGLNNNVDMQRNKILSKSTNSMPINKNYDDGNTTNTSSNSWNKSEKNKFSNQVQFNLLSDKLNARSENELNKSGSKLDNKNQINSYKFK